MQKIRSGFAEHQPSHSGWQLLSPMVLAGYLLLALPSTEARADWINLTGAETAANIAEIYVLDDRVKLVLEIYIGDFETFVELVPDELFKDPSGRATLEERLRSFSDRTFQVVTDRGEKLRARLDLVEPRSRIDRKSPYAGMTNPMTGRPVPKAPADKRVLYAEISYPFEQKPTALTFIPPMDDNGRAIVATGFIVYHKSVPVIDFGYLGAPAQLKLDWDDPWYSTFDNPNLKRQHKNPLMLFLYVEPRQVRYEILARIRDLQDWTDLGLSGSTIIGINEQAKVKQRVLDFFATLNPLQIDSMPVTPTMSRAEFLNLSVSGLQVVEDVDSIDLSTAVIGVSLSYPASHLPQKVRVEWDLFNDRISRIPVTETDPAGPLVTYVDVENPSTEWQNFLLKYVEPQVVPVPVGGGRSFAVPIVSLVLLLGVLFGLVLTVRPRYLSRTIWVGVSIVCAAAAILLTRVAVIDIRNPFAGLPDGTESAKIVTAVLDNVHTAYLETADPELERALSVVVAKENFADIKTEFDRALAIKVTGGGIARVNAIEGLVVKDISVLDNRAGFRLVAEWTALANANHWGHPHRRRIRFRALMELGEAEGLWKFVGMTVVSAQQEN